MCGRCLRETEAALHDLSGDLYHPSLPVALPQRCQPLFSVVSSSFSSEYVSVTLFQLVQFVRS